MTTKTPTATGRTTADQPTTQARPQGTHSMTVSPLPGRLSRELADHPDTEAAADLAYGRDDRRVGMRPSLDRAMLSDPFGDNGGAAS
jgi:hypothetical protein